MVANERSEVSPSERSATCLSAFHRRRVAASELVRGAWRGRSPPTKKKKNPVARFRTTGQRIARNGELLDELIADDDADVVDLVFCQDRCVLDTGADMMAAALEHGRVEREDEAEAVI